jgi:hypothetical protein
MTGYYDYVLGLIPLTLFGLTGGLAGVGLTLTQAVPIAAAVAAGIVAHALFVRSPVAAGTRSGQAGIDTGTNVSAPNAD